MDLLKESGINLPEEVLKKNKEEGRCSGHCCVGFVFPLSLKDLDETIEAKKSDSELPKDHNCKRFFKTYDLAYFEKLKEMFVEQDRSYSEGLNPNLFKKDRNDEKALLSNIEETPGFYSCTFLDKSTGNCTSYESRPDFCKSFPSRGVCDYTGCTSSCSRESIVKKVPVSEGGKVESVEKPD